MDMDDIILVATETINDLFEFFRDNLLEIQVFKM